MYSSKQAPFLVTETNAGSIGFSSMNESPYHGQWRQLAGIPGRAYHEIARTGQELREAGGAFGAAEPDYDITVLYDSDSYRHIVAAFSRGIFDAKRHPAACPAQLELGRGDGFPILDSDRPARRRTPHTGRAGYSPAVGRPAFPRRYR
jgi:hypothetical protein